jgi:membrane protein
MAIAGAALWVAAPTWRASGLVPDKHEIDAHGREAEVPESIPTRGLRDVFWRVFHEVSTDRVMLISAGVTFYLLLAIFPALAALVSLYGMIADPSTMADHLNALASLLPPGSFEIVADQIASLAASRDRTLGLTFFVGLTIALLSTRNGVLAIFDAMNVAYDEEEKRGFVKRNLIGLVFTIGGVLGLSALIGVVAVFPAILAYLWLDGADERLLPDPTLADPAGARFCHRDLYLPIWAKPLAGVSTVADMGRSADGGRVDRHVRRLVLLSQQFRRL